MAVVSALSVLVVLTAPMLALLSASAFERLIARNLVEAGQALFVAEAGVEWAFNLLVDTSDWNAAVPAGAPTTLVPPDGLLPWGSAAITVRRGDEPTGTDAVIVTSTGTVNGARRTVEAVVRRSAAGAAGGPRGAQGIFSLHAVVDWRER